MDFRVLIGFLATFVALIGYIPYFKDIFAGKTKPHAFSWLVFGTITLIAFFGQLAGNGGPGTWVTGFSGLVSFTIFYLALKRGEKKIVQADWIALIGAFVAIALWLATKNPLLSVILVTIISIFGVFPTVRKSWIRPYSETSITYTLTGVKFLLGILALESFSLLTVLYPLILILMNWSFVGMLYLRRKQVV